MKSLTAALFVETPSILAEGPLWHDKKLFWVDIDGKKLNVANEDGQLIPSWEFDTKVTMVCEHGQGGLLVAGEEHLFRFFPETGKRESFTTISRETPTSRCNDGKVDPFGRLWIGTMTAPERRAGGLYRVDINGKVTRVLDGITVSNGLSWSEEGDTMYYIDSVAREVWSFDFENESGTIANRRTIATIPNEWGVPDGMTIDRTGNLWVAIWGASKVVCWNPKTGELLTEVVLPCSQITSCCFGGKELDTLYITSARAGLSEEKLKQEPLAGCIFKCTPGVRGFLSTPFGKQLS